VLALTLVGCATTPVPQVLIPQMVPEEFTGETGISSQAWPRPDWWLGFNSPELSDLIATARTANLDLAAAFARVLESQAQTTIARSALFPQSNARAQAQRSSVGNGQSTLGQSASTGDSFGLTLGASYDLDLWGLARSNLRAARETLKSARFAQQAVALSITANVANEYFSVLALRKRISIANENIAAINGILDIIKLKVATGKSSHLELAQEQAQAEAVKALLPILEQQEREARVALAVLLGRTPEAFDVTAADLEALQPPAISPGLPSDLLLRRPDVAQAEANLAGAHANLDAARAAFLPQFALTGSGGFASTAIEALLRSSNFAWSYGATMLQTVFDGGQLRGKKALAQATQMELIASYRGAVLNAYADVENALGQVTNSRKAEDHLKREIDAAREAFTIAQLQYRQGATDLLTILQAQQTLFSAEDQLAQTMLAHMQAVVHLFEALGGGWIEGLDERTQFTSAR
jgi:NodT family efflux transporter outer membrane factor (OMF) lipoprotein